MSMLGKSKTGWIILIALAAGIKILSLSPDAVEKYYSTGIYPVIARLERLLFGWLPFSVGDIFYTLAAIGLLYGLVSLVRRLIRRQADNGFKDAGREFAVGTPLSWCKIAPAEASA